MSDSVDLVSKSSMAHLAATWCCLGFICTFAQPALLLAQCTAASVPLDTVIQDPRAVVFVGVARSVERTGSTETATFDVERVWKGVVKEQTVIYRPLSPTQNTGTPFSFRQTRYLVIAHQLDAEERRRVGLGDDGDAVGTDTCGGGSRLLAPTEPELGPLGPGRGPTEQQIRLRNAKLVAPIRTKYVAPVYSDEARRANIRGTVLIEIWLDETGRVTRSEVIRSIASLNQAAVEAVAQWEYLPAMFSFNSSPVPTVLGVVVTFPP
jgi:protein TonB